MNELPLRSGSPAVEWTTVGGVRETPLESVQEIWRFRPLIAELVRRDLKVRYKNRVGGVLWSLFPPLMQVVTINLMVKFLTQVQDYSAYLMPVMFLWQFFQNIVLDASQSMVANAALARKIYFPRAILPIVSLISNLMHFSVSIGFTLLYLAIVPISKPILFNGNLSWRILLLPFFVVGASVLSIGIGYLLAYLNTLYEDVRFLTITFMGLFFYAVPVLYPIESVAAKPGIFPLYMLNPMATWMVAFQRSLLHPILTKSASGKVPVEVPFERLWPYIGIASVSSLAIFLFGFWIFERSKWTMMERL